VLPGRRAALVIGAAALATLPAVLAPSAGTAAVVVPAAAGPTPSSWEGGHAVPVAPRWWPQGYSQPSAAWRSGWPKPVEFSPTRTGALSGMRIGLDPGHDIGNSSHLSQINAYYWVGLRKTCNTTGTATNAGYAEATYNFDVAARVRRLLTSHGATVVLTRDRNTTSTYGPCVGARGSLGKQEKVRFMVAVHADGGPSTGRGFHVIAPAYYKGYTDDIYTQSRTLATSMIAGLKAGGLTPTTYLSSPLSVRKDVGSHNMSDVPIITVETLNMRNSSDARIASTSSGRQKVAYAIYLGILRYARSL
jgi:N-acetylmuramoyl-L-alanine amidase